MTEFYGKDLMFQWKTSSGTTDMSEYQRGVTYSPTGKIDVNTTGSAVYETRQVGVKDFTLSYKGLHQGGTVIESECAFGKVGTAYIYPQGSAAGTPFYTLPAISQGVQMNWVYDGLTEINVSFIGNGSAAYGTA